MQIQITEESHNLLAWEVRTPLLYIEIGLLGLFILSPALLAPSGHPWRWLLITLLMLFCLALALFLGSASPLSERCRVEWTPQGGLIHRKQQWLLKGEQVAWESSLEPVTAFWVEERGFEETGHRVVRLARLWMRLSEQPEVVALTGWAPLERIDELAESVAQAARLPWENAPQA